MDAMICSPLLLSSRCMPRNIFSSGMKEEGSIMPMLPVFRRACTRHAFRLTALSSTSNVAGIPALLL